MSYESVVKEDTPKGYWRLGEANGTEAKDASGNTQTGTYKGAPTLGTAGALVGDPDTAVTLNGTSQWISVPDSAVMDLGDTLTYECWFKRGATGTQQTLLDKGPNALIVRFLTSNKILVRRNSVANICESTVAVTDTTTWHHLAVTKSGATVKIWLDGVDRTGSVTNSTLENTSVILSIGASEAGTEEWWKGSLDEVAVYGAALSEARAKAHFTAGRTKLLADAATPTEVFTKRVAKSPADSTTPTETWSVKLVEPGPKPVTPAAAVLSEPVDDTLFVKLTTAEGRHGRLSGIEDRAENIATGITASNTAPGGHRSAGMTLLRDPRLMWSDLNFIDDVVIYGRTRPLGRNVFEGMAEQFPAQVADTSSITISAVGNQALLSENEAWRALYVDLGFSNWEEARLPRKRYLAETLSVPQGKIAVSTGEDGLVWSVPAGQQLSIDEQTDVTYRAPAGCPVAAFAYKGKMVKDWSKFEAPAVFTSEQEFIGGEIGEWGLILDDTSRTVEFDASWEYLMLRARVSTAVAPEAGTMQTYSALATYGDTGVPLREIPGRPPGVYAHDVLAHIVSTGAPDLNYTIGGDGSIVPNTSFVMPDFAPTEGGKPWDAIEKLNAYFLNNFGVWDDKEFFWKPWDPEDVNWQVSIAGGAQWTPVGRQAVTLLNGLVVNYTDAEGVSRFAGPPGSGCDYESPLLVNPDPTNPYTRRGRRRWGTLNVGFPLAYPTTAFQVGSVVLAESTMPQRSGQLTIRPLGPGHVPSITHPTIGRLPIWALRAGDFATLMDWPVPEALRVTQVDYTHDTKTLTAQLDSGAARLTAILERTGSRLTV